MPSWVGIAVLVIAGLFLARVTRGRGCAGTGGFGRAALLIGGLVLGGWVLARWNFSPRVAVPARKYVSNHRTPRDVRFGYQRPSDDFGNIGTEELRQYREQVGRRARMATRGSDIAEAESPFHAGKPASTAAPLPAERPEPPTPATPPANASPPPPAAPEVQTKKVQFDAGPLHVQFDTDEESGVPSSDEITRAAAKVAARATVEAVKHFAQASGDAAKKTAQQIASASTSAAKIKQKNKELPAESDVVATSSGTPTAESVPSSADASADRAPAAAAPTGTTTSKRPAWVDGPLGKQGGVYRTKFETGPYATKQDCDQAVPTELLQSARAIINQYIGASNRIPNETLLPYLRQRVVKEEWPERRRFESLNDREMVNLHVLLEFDDRSWRELDRMQHEREIEDRVAMVGIGAGWLMALLGTVFGYLKLDTLTRGYYTRRLQLVAGAVILTLIGAAVAAMD